MINMPHCRFENTYKAFIECLEHWNDELSESEERYAEKLLEAIKEAV